MGSRMMTHFKEQTARLKKVTRNMLSNFLHVECARWWADDALWYDCVVII